MKILNEITKEMFEQFVPVARMPERSDSVFARLSPLFDQAYYWLLQHIVGRQFEERLATEKGLTYETRRFVCLKTFTDHLRSLDVVLTATGFGIVSTNSTAPASQARVEALAAQLRLETALCCGTIIEGMLRVPQWGSSPLARTVIDILFWNPQFVERYTSQKPSADTIQKMRQLARTADAFLRSEISDEYMDELLDKTRTSALNAADYVIVDKCNRFTADYVSQENPTPNRMMLDGIVRQLEGYSTQYTTYTQSRLYQSRHAEKYRNEREDPTFFFV